MTSPAQEQRLARVAGVLETLGADVGRALTTVNIVAHVVDREGRIAWQNDASRRLIGDARGVSIFEFVAPESMRRVREAFQSKVLGLVAATDYDAEAVLPSGERARIDISSVPLVADDRVVGVFVVVRNPPVPRPNDVVPLTPRQLEVVRLLARGASTDEIAETLHIARETVRNHIRGALGALGVHSRVEAVAAARAAGLVDD